MTDELYDYFGGNASKKVEPIEDDDLDSTEDESEEVSRAEQESPQTESTQSTGSEIQPAEKNRGTGISWQICWA